MNTRPPIEAGGEAPALSVTFNNDASRFSVGLSSGFAIFHSATFHPQAHTHFNAGISMVQMMGNANYLALVGGGRNPMFPPNKVIIWDDSKHKAALEITTLMTVRGVQLSQSRVVVVLRNSVRVYAFEKQPKPLAVYETANNLEGLCLLTDKWLVFPGRTVGQVQVVELATESVSIIPAHTSQLHALQLSDDGELLATASEKGTIIRIFSTSSGAKLAERRRGSEFAAIYSLRFNPSGKVLACTSSKGSLHVFDVVPPSSSSAPSRDTPPLSPETDAAASGYGGIGAAAPVDGTKKWGFLSNIPWGPFSDVYSFASAPFQAGEETNSSPSSTVEEAGTLSTGKSSRGVLGWIDDITVLVLSAGRDAQWERFRIVGQQDGRRILKRDAWKRYLTVLGD